MERKLPTPIYAEMKGWQETLTVETLPAELVYYVQYLEDELDLPVKIVSIGPGRNELVVRK